VVDVGDLQMWGYVVLAALDRMRPRTQAAPARTIGADKTRIIGVLDDLQERDLIRPTGGFASSVSPRPAAACTQKVRQAIRREEDRFLAQLAIQDREVFLRILQALDAHE
jgi:hypothetical protein